MDTIAAEAKRKNKIIHNQSYLFNHIFIAAAAAVVFSAAASGEKTYFTLFRSCRATKCSRPPFSVVVAAAVACCGYSS
jgi:hypothetical protein